MVQRKKTKKTPSAARYLLFFSFTTAMLTGGFFFYTKVPHRPSQKTKTMVFASLRTQPKGTTTNKHYWIRSQCLDTSINRARICKKWRDPHTTCQLETQHAAHAQPCTRIALGPYHTMDLARTGEKFFTMHKLQSHLE